MADPCLVEWCSRPVGDGYVCETCSEKLRIALGDVNSLWEDLDAVLAKQARYAASEARRGERGLPLNLEASEIGWVLRNTLNTWCKLVAEERGWDLPEDRPAKVAGWLLHQVEWIRHQRAGHQAIEEITSAVNAVRRAVDRPAERLYAGPCKECGTHLYGKHGQTSFDCPKCATTLTIDSQMDWMDAVLLDKIVTAREGSSLLARYGLEVRWETINKWRQRGKLEARGKDRDEAWVYPWLALKKVAEEMLVEREEAS